MAVAAFVGPTGAYGGPSPAAVATAVGIVANRSLALSADETGKAPSSGLARPNRPARLSELTDLRPAPIRDEVPSAMGEFENELDESPVYEDRDLVRLTETEDDAAGGSGKTPAAGGTTTTPAEAPESPTDGADMSTGLLESGPTAVGDDGFIRSVTVSDVMSRRIVLPKNTSAVIDLAEKIDRAEVNDEKTADVRVDSPTRIVVEGKSIGSTQMQLTAAGRTRSIEIVVEQDLRALRDLIKSASPTSRVQARSLNGTILLTGEAGDAGSIQRIIEMAEMVQGGPVRSQIQMKGVQQTLLKVVVAEVSKTASRRLGINWSLGASNLSRDFFFANNLNQINPTIYSSSGVGNVIYDQQIYSVGAVGNGVNTNVTFGFPKAELQLFVNALRENNLFRVLAEPNLVAINGQTASFLAGGEVPIPVTQGGATAGAIVIEYKEFGVRLSFTPTLLGDQRVRIHVMAEVSDAVPGTSVIGGLPVFSFTTRRVESTIECGNGQTFSIAGLLRERVQAVASKIPGLGDVPVLGTLFSSTDYQKADTELVVLVTPNFVEPLDPQQVAPPAGALSTTPNDFELFMMQQLEGKPLSRSEYEAMPRGEDLPVKVHPRESKWTGGRLTLHGPLGNADYEEN